MKRTVLIVDDHPASAPARAGCSRPRATRWSARPATRRAAIAAVRELRPDLVLLDVQLPDLDGFDVAARLTGDAECPAVVLTSSRDSSDFGALIVVLRRARLRAQERAVRGGAGRDPRMRRLRARWWASACSASLYGAGGRAADPRQRPRRRSRALRRDRPVIGWSFIGTGLFAWWRRPENRFGALLVAVGFAWFTSGLIAAERARASSLVGAPGRERLHRRSSRTRCSPSRPAGWRRGGAPDPGGGLDVGLAAADPAGALLQDARRALLRRTARQPAADPDNETLLDVAVSASSVDRHRRRSSALPSCSCAAGGPLAGAAQALANVLWLGLAAMGAVHRLQLPILTLPICRTASPTAVHRSRCWPSRRGPVRLPRRPAAHPLLAGGGRRTSSSSGSARRRGATRACATRCPTRSAIPT